MIAPLNDRYRPVTQAALRIAAGAAYFSHGAQKLFGWFGGVGPDGGAAELMSRFGAAGVIEVVAGFCILIGFGTRLAAFIASGEMAVAYFWMHTARNGSIWWWENQGEVVMLFCFIFLAFAAWGAGPLSVDKQLAKRRRGLGS
jgi:putative oxidoreductase